MSDLIAELRAKIEYLESENNALRTAKDLGKPMYDIEIISGWALYGLFESEFKSSFIPSKGQILNFNNQETRLKVKNVELSYYKNLETDNLEIDKVFLWCEYYFSP